MQAENRQRWMGLLARADASALSALIEGLGEVPSYELLRRPESGLVMVRGRAGGSGKPFNLGEMTVTRCSVRTADGGIGHAYVQGRRPEHAERAALLDALLQDPDRTETLMAEVVAPLERRETERREARLKESAATRVEFFTMVRGEDDETGD